MRVASQSAATMGEVEAESFLNGASYQKGSTNSLIHQVLEFLAGGSGE